MRLLILFLCLVSINSYAKSLTETNDNHPVACVGINDVDNKIEKILIGARFVINGQIYEFAEHKEHDDYMMIRSQKIGGQDKYYFYFYDGKKNNSFLFIKNNKGETLRGTRLICVSYHLEKF